jgi:hypothetical protein
MSEVLAMLAPKNSNMESVGHSTGGESRRPEDVAAALGGIVNKHILYYAYVKWCGDTQLFSELLQEARIAERYRFKIKGYGKPQAQIDSFARVALTAALIPRHCKTCKGTGEVMNGKGNGWVECPACKGSGLGKDISDRALESLMKSDHRTIKSFWRLRLNESLSEYNEWDALVDSHVKKRLK